jgi:hypothetical protein
MGKWCSHFATKPVQGKFTTGVDRKIQKVLIVYRDVSFHSESAVHDARPQPISSLAVGELAETLQPSGHQHGYD